LIWSFAAKALLAGVIIAAIAEVGRRLPAMAALIASLPLVSILGMIFLWHARPDAENMATHAQSTFWFVLPSLPMFLLMPVLLRQGFGFWTALAAGCLLTILLYLLMVQFGPRLGIRF
jgi:polyferredoxin